MGYRPNIYINGEHIIEFGKFYGYVDLDNLKSIKWLEDYNKIDEDERFFGGYGPAIKFTADEFREFWDLYIQDINEYDFIADGHIGYEKPYDPEMNWAYWNGSSGTTFKEAIYDTDDEKNYHMGIIRIRRYGMNKDDILVVKYPFLMKNTQDTQLYESILKQRENGVIIIPDYCEVVIAPKDVEIKMENILW